MMQDLNMTQVQLDELWTFVRKKERMLKDWEKLYSEWGDTWVWVAFDPVHKLVIAVLVGERGEEEATLFDCSCQEVIQRINCGKKGPFCE